MNSFTCSLLVLACLCTATTALITKSSRSGSNMRRTIRKYRDNTDGETGSDNFIFDRRRTTIQQNILSTWGRQNESELNIWNQITKTMNGGSRCPSEYWFDSRIHTLGNIGIGGGFHAATTPLFTKLIDDIAYKGIDIRQEVSKQSLSYS